MVNWTWSELDSRILGCEVRHIHVLTNCSCWKANLATQYPCHTSFGCCHLHFKGGGIHHRSCLGLCILAWQQGAVWRDLAKLIQCQPEMSQLMPISHLHFCHVDHCLFHHLCDPSKRLPLGHLDDIISFVFLPECCIFLLLLSREKSWELQCNDQSVMGVTWLIKVYCKLTLCSLHYGEMPRLGTRLRPCKSSYNTHNSFYIFFYCKLRGHTYFIGN